MASHRDEVLLYALGLLALGDVSDRGDHRHPLPIANEEVGAGFDEALAAVGMLDPGLVAGWGVGSGEDRVVLRFRRRPHLFGKDEGETLSDGLLWRESIERTVRGIDSNDGARSIG